MEIIIFNIKFHSIILWFCWILLYFIAFRFQWFQKSAVKFWTCVDWFKIRKFQTWHWCSICVVPLWLMPKINQHWTGLESVNVLTKNYRLVSQVWPHPNLELKLQLLFVKNQNDCKLEQRNTSNLTSKLFCYYIQGPGKSTALLSAFRNGFSAFRSALLSAPMLH
jgi:hypothetical protein